MQKAAQALIGEHNFLSFCAAGSGAKTFTRTIYSIEIKKTQTIDIHITGNGFLYNMVRIIAGTLSYIGYGKIPQEQMATILAAKDRTKAGITAPPQGLTLMEVHY